MIVDDGREDARALATTLMELGITNPIRAVHSGLEALAFIQGDYPFSDRTQYPSPRVIFLDLKMPGMDGFAVLQSLASQGKLKDLTVFVVSGLNDLPSIRKAYEMGAKSFVIKPCLPDEIEELIKVFPTLWSRKHARISPSVPDIRDTTSTAS